MKKEICFVPMVENSNICMIGLSEVINTEEPKNFINVKIVVIAHIQKNAKKVNPTELLE